MDPTLQNFQRSSQKWFRKGTLGIHATACQVWNLILPEFSAQNISRLGVGASVPEGYNAAAREIARLKGKLAGTKHSREDDDAIAPQQLSDTEAESKAAAIKKRPKYDPFDVVHGKKKKKKEENIDPQPVATNSNVTQLQATISPKGTEACNQCLDEPKPTSPTLTPSKKKKKWKKLKVEEGVEDREAGPSSALLRNGSGNVVNHPSTPPRSAGESVPCQQIWLIVHETGRIASECLPYIHTAVEYTTASTQVYSFRSSEGAVAQPKTS